MDWEEAMCVSSENKFQPIYSSTTPLSSLPQDQLDARYELFLQLECQTEHGV